MASQTEAQVKTEIGDRIAILHEIYKSASVNASGNISNYVAREQTAQNDVAGDYSVQSDDALKGSVRAALAGAVSSSVAASVIGPLILNYALVDGTIGETDVTAAFARIYRRHVLNTLSVKSRNITFASWAASSAIGNGAINRLTVDENGFDIESVTVEAKRAECVADQNQGGTPQHEEQFQFRGATRKPDQLAIPGSGLVSDPVSAASCRTTPFSNSSFDQLDGTSITALTTIPGWTVGAEGIANYNLDTTNYYRDFQGATTPAALKFLSNGNVSQKFSANNVKCVQNQPYYAQIAYNRSIGSCDGILWFSVGNTSVQVTLAAQSGWQILRIPIGRNCWPKNFAAANDPIIKIQLTNRTSGTLLVDDIIFAPFVAEDGTWHLPVGGSVKWVANNHDAFTLTDTLVGADSVNQYWFWRALGLYLPGNKVGGETWTDPAV